MRNDDYDYTLRDIIDMYDEKFIVDVLIDDGYYVDVMAENIREIIPEMDKEDQDLYNDLRDDKIIINAFRDLVGDSELVSLLADAGYAYDIVRLIERDYIDEDY